MREIPVALQLYSVRSECSKDFEKTIERVSEIGYEGVEFAGYYGKSAKELKELLERYNLKVAGSHTPLNSLLGEEFEKTVEFNLTLGNKYLIIPSLPEEYIKTKDGLKKTIEVLNELSEKLKNFGLKVGYHNHAVEFQKIDGEIPWYIIFDNVKEDVVMQIDTGNAIHGGGDPVEALKRYKERVKTVHLKEYPFSARAIGEGVVNWKEILNLCASGGTEWYIVEYENQEYPPLESVKLCLENLKKMMK